MDNEHQYLDANKLQKGAFIGGMAQGFASAQNAYTVPAPAASLADRLGNLAQIAHGSGTVLGSARERLCGMWPEAGSNQASKPASAQIEGLLDELQSALTRIAEHAQAINSRI